MQKLSFITTMLMSATIALGLTSLLSPLPNEEEIDLKEVTILPPTGPKSGAANPISAWFNHDLCMLRLETNGMQGPIIVSIEDEVSLLVFEEVVNGNQTTIKVPLPPLFSGCYKLTLKSSAWLLTGTFEVY